MSDEQTLIRAFFAIDLPDSTKMSIAGLMHDLQPHYPENAVRWVRPQSLHITLQFLRHIRRMDLQQLMPLAAVALQQLTPFEMTLGPVQFFPSHKKPHMLALNTEPQVTLQQLSKALAECLVAINIPPEKRLFRGHITLGRFNSDATDDRILPTLPDTDPLTFIPQQITLFQSQPQPTASHYIPLHHFPLGVVD